MLKAIETARRRMPDFRIVTFNKGNEDERRLDPFDTVERHLHSRAWLESQLVQPFAGQTVVVTHHAPSRQSIASTFAGDILSPAFASNLDSLMGPRAALWIHGHVHDSFDYEVDGTRVVCNPRGYAPGELNSAFVQAMFVDV